MKNKDKTKELEKKVDKLTMDHNELKRQINHMKGVMMKKHSWGATGSLR